jgi:hypothetical protein
MLEDLFSQAHNHDFFQYECLRTNNVIFENTIWEMPYTPIIPIKYNDKFSLKKY